MKASGHKKIKQSQRQRMSLKFIVATGIAVTTIVLVLVIYFQFFKNEITKAQNPVILTQDALPVALEIEQIAIVPADTNLRNGVRFKVAKPLPVASTTE